MAEDRARERMSPRRRAVLDAVRGAAAAPGVAEIADLVAVHPNTVRFHLDALVADGHVERVVRPPAGPGRPRTVYAARPGMDRGGARRYHLLARILLSRLTPPAPKTEAAGTALTTPPGTASTEAEAVAAGRDWGGYLVERPPPAARPPSAGEAAGRLAAMLADLGFDPQPTGTAPETIRLRHCPFLELAEEYGHIVCPLHLGLMQGALTELRAPITATRLDPFAAPDACVAHLGPADTG